MILKPTKYCNFRYLTSIPYWLTYTRSGNAWAVQNGILKSYGTDEPRLISSEGLLFEDESENIFLDNRDFGGGGWNVTGSASAGVDTGLDGVYNTGQVLIAGADGDSIYQIITAAYNVYTISLYLKSYSTNTGKIYYSADGVTYYEAVGVSSDSFTRYELTVQQSNPSIYMKLEKAGDKLVYDCGQIEQKHFATSPIVTAGSPVTRNADILYTNAYDFSGGSWEWLKATSGVFNIEADLTPQSTSCVMQIYNNVSASDYAFIKVLDSSYQYFNVGVNQDWEVSVNPDDVTQLANRYNLALSYADNYQIASVNGYTLGAAQTQTVDMSNTLRWYIGSKGDGTEHINGYIRQIGYFNQSLNQTDLNDLTQTNIILIGWDFATDVSESFIERVAADSGTFEALSCLTEIINSL